jgi:hypothetical protein
MRLIVLPCLIWAPVPLLSRMQDGLGLPQCVHCMVYCMVGLLHSPVTITRWRAEAALWEVLRPAHAG